MKFLALDVETANADYSSICQIGIAEFEDGQITDTWSTLINPEAHFDGFNIRLSGICEEDVKEAPAFDQIYNELSKRITGQITIHHMPFDRIAISRACNEYNLNVLEAIWLDSAKIVRRTWKQFAYNGYRLTNIAAFLNIEFKHHDALEDAIAAGKIVSQACKETEVSIEEWCKKIRQPIFDSTTIKLEGNPGGPLYGENLVFTGKLSLPRKEVGKIAADLGCNISNSVNKNTTMLVVGIQDASKLAGYEKSSKHRKTEELIQKGIPITILSEKDFIEICNNENENLNLEVSQALHSSETIEKRQPDKKESQDKMEFEIKFDQEQLDGIADKINRTWGSLTDEQKEAIYKADQEHQDLIKSISDFTHEEKRTLAKKFQSYLENIKQYYHQFNIESFEDEDLDDMDMIGSVHSSIWELEDGLYELMKNKATLGEFLESLTDNIDFLSDELEEARGPKPVKKYAGFAIKELEKIEKKLLALANKG